MEKTKLNAAELHVKTFRIDESKAEEFKNLFDKYLLKATDPYGSVRRFNEIRKDREKIGILSHHLKVMATDLENKIELLEYIIDNTKSERVTNRVKLSLARAYERAEKKGIQ